MATLRYSYVPDLDYGSLPTLYQLPSGSRVTMSYIGENRRVQIQEPYMFDHRGHPNLIDRAWCEEYPTPR